MRNRILMMATTSDLIALMKAVEARKSLMYTLTGFPAQPDLQQTNSFSEIEGFGVSGSGKMGLERSFLLSEPTHEIKVRPVAQQDGTMKYRIFTQLNPKTLLITIGGVFEGNIVVSSELMKYSSEPEAVEMFALFQKVIRSQFKKHSSYPYWLGEEAAKLHASGCRLTDDVASTFSLPAN